MLKWVHDIAGVANPMTNPFVKTVVEEVKRENAKPVVKKTAPISKDILTACCEKYATCNELPIRRDISIALLFFAFFFRFSELASLTIKDIAISDYRLRGYGTLKYGDVHEKFNFSEMQELRPLRTCQKHFETILPNFLLNECEIQGKYSVV